MSRGVNIERVIASYEPPEPEVIRQRVDAALRAGHARGERERWPESERALLAPLPHGIA